MQAVFQAPIPALLCSEQLEKLIFGVARVTDSAVSVGRDIAGWWLRSHRAVWLLVRVGHCCCAGRSTEGLSRAIGSAAPAMSLSAPIQVSCSLRLALWVAMLRAYVAPEMRLYSTRTILGLRHVSIHDSGCCRPPRMRKC